MTPIEKLAREICWRELTTRPKEATKARYWRDLPNETKARYVNDAEWLLWIIPRIPDALVDQLDAIEAVTPRKLSWRQQ